MIAEERTLGTVSSGTDRQPVIAEIPENIPPPYDELPTYNDLQRTGSFDGRFDSFFDLLPQSYKQYQRMFIKNLHDYDEIFKLSDHTLNMEFGIVNATHRKKILETIEMVRPEHESDSDFQWIPGITHPVGVNNDPRFSYTADNGRRVTLQSRNIYAFDVEDSRYNNRRNSYSRRRTINHDDEPCPIYIFVCLTCFFSPICGFVGLCAFARANNNPNYPNKAQAYKFLLLSTFLSLVLWILVSSRNYL